MTCLVAQCPDGTPPPCAARQVAAAPTASQYSVAVLYFDNLSRDTSDAYLADGLTEEITSRLGDVRRLEVKSRNAVRPFRGEAAADLTAVGRRLRVRYLVEGSVRRAAARVRVSVRLVRADNGFRVWGADYDRGTEDILALQEEIAREVATNIAGQLLPQERARLGARPTRNAAAYDHYLRANFFLAQRQARPARIAIEEYQAAVRLDPDFTDAQARIALTCALFLDWGWPYPGLTRDSILAMGREAGVRALARDSTNAEAWLGRGYMLAWEEPRTFRGVLPALERAIALDPRNAEALHQYGWFLWSLGRDDEALAAFRRTLTIEPGRAITMEHIARVLLMQRRYVEARPWLDSAIAADPTNPFFYSERTIIRLALADTAGARADAATSDRLSPEDFKVYAATARGLVAAATGDTATAMRIMAATLQTMPEQRAWWLAFNFAPVLAALGRRDEALDLLQQIEPRGVYLWNSLRAPGLDALRSSPRFQRLVEETRPPGAPR